jgi:hypothetical protein
MKARLLMAAVVLAGIGIGSTAHAESIEGKTRAEVYEELVEAQRNGLRYITDLSYPGIAPMHAPRVAKQKQQMQKQTDDPKVASANEPPAKPISSGSARSSGALPDCQGPVSFCNPYFGS